MQATASAQPNIALIKYWGKRDIEQNLPAVGSISITLCELFTRMHVRFDATLPGDRLTVNDAPAPAMLLRVSTCLDQVVGADRPRAAIASTSNFPIAAGLASSASSFAALVVAAAAAADKSYDRATLASLAGRASGSAARSLYGGYVELANDGDAILVSEIRAPETWPLTVVVAVTEPGPKPVGSTEAMEISRATSPFYRNWVTQQDEDLAVARAAIAERDFGRLAAIAEHNCLKMHSIMWASRPPVVYWNAATMRCLQTIRGLQGRGVDVFFTIDAGPQVKAVCGPESATAVEAALRRTEGVTRVLTTGLGAGARLEQGA
ncbi:MAG: diphosphomevalonate decarboxylase [Woeseiaceae bacterium]|jgi:diphosphomevalonate decarboxylase